MVNWGQALAGAGSLLGGAASVASIFAGKNAQEANARALRQITDLSQTGAEGILSQTAPLRAVTAGTLFNRLTGGPIEAAPEREAIEGQFTRARENILATTPSRGGQLNRMLADVEVGRAQSVAGLESDLRKRAFEDALRIGFQVAPATVFPTFQGLAGTFGGLAGQGMELQAAGGAGLGQIAAIGSLLAMKQGKK